MVAIEFFGDVSDDDVVPVLSAEPMIAVGGQHLNSLSLDPHDGDVESSATQVEDKNGLVFVELVEAVGNSRRRGLVDNLENVESRQLPRRDRRRAFGIVEIGGDRYHRIRYRFLEVFFRVRLELA